MKYSNPYKIIVFTIISLFIYTGASYPAPSGGNVSHGDANINQSGGNTTINQNSDKAIINWGSFDVGNGESVIFNQKDSNSITLNRVTGSGASVINGSLSANGKVFILNSNGILIGNGASINTGSFLASTGKMSDNDFMNGNYNIHSAIGDITNNGTITVDNYGYAALLGRKVVNNGVISANLGRVEIASGEAFRVSFYDNNLIGVSIEKGAADAYISNNGKITAEGGTIYMSAKGLSDLLKSTINNEGVIYAGSITKDNGGRIVLSAEFGDVNNNSLIDVSSDIGKAGNVEIYGNDIIIESENAVVDASGESGGNVYIKASENAEVKDKATVTASGTTGNGGGVSVLSKGVLFFDKGTSLLSQSVTGNGGFIEVSSVEDLHIKGTANTLSVSGEHGSFILDPYNIVITNTTLTKSSITGLLINDINIALATNGSFTLNAVDISMDPSAYGVPIGTGIGDLSFIATNSINLVSPNIDVDKLTMTAEYDINMSKDPLQTGNIKANEFKLTALLGNTQSIGVTLDIGNLLLSSPEGSTELDSLASVTGMNLSGVIGKNLKLTSTVNPINIIVNNTLSAGDSISFDMRGVGSTLISGFVNIITKTLNLDIPFGMANLRDTSFEKLTAVIGDLTITNSSVVDVTVDSLTVTSSLDYKQSSLSSVIFNDVIFDPIIVAPTRVKIELNKGKLTFPFEAAVAFFTALDIEDASTIIFNAGVTPTNPNGSIDLTVASGSGGLTGTDFFTKFGQTTAGSAKLLSFEAVGNVELNIVNRLVNSSLSMKSELGFVTGECAGSNCIMASISAEANGDILIDKFGTKSYSAISKTGDITINMSPLPGVGAGVIPASSITFVDLITGNTGTITLTSAPNALVLNAPINILNLNTGSGGLVLNLLNTTSFINIISKTVGDLNIHFTGTNNKFGSFSVVSEGGIKFINSFDFTSPMIFLSLTSKFDDISLVNTSITTDTSISLSANNIIGPILNLTTGAGTPTIEESITLNIHGDTQGEFNIDASNTGILNLGGNVKVNINSATTIGSVGGSSTSMTGNIVVNGTGGIGGHLLTLKNIANLDSFLAEGVGSVILDPTFKATTTGEFSIDASGNILSFKDAATGDKASIHADHISLIADTIGGMVGIATSVLPTPANYTDSAIMVEANSGYFEAANIGGHPASIDIGSADFMSSLFKYEFLPAPAVDTTAFLNGLNIHSSWYEDLNNSRNDYYLYNPDLRYHRHFKYDIYDEILALGDDLIVSDIVYLRYIHAKFKVGNSIFLK